jgi:hypothetical protein
MDAVADRNEIAELKRQVSEATAALQVLNDRMAIQDLLNTYARGIDRGDIEVLKTVYHPDGQDEHGIFSGRGHDFAGFVTPYIKANYRMMQHHHTTTSINIRGHEADVELYFFCVQQKPDNDLEFSAGRCADKFEKRAGRWGIAHRQVIMDWTWVVPNATPTSIDDKFEKGQYAERDASHRLLPALRESALTRR